MKNNLPLEVVIEVAKALEDWDGSVEQASQKLTAAVKAVKRYAEAYKPPVLVDFDRDMDLIESVVKMTIDHVLIDWLARDVKDAYYKDHYQPLVDAALINVDKEMNK